MQESVSPAFDLVCLSHLRWDFVYQRPQHLLSRCAQQRRVFFVEEPLYGDGPAHLSVDHRQDELYVVTPHLPRGTHVSEQLLIDEALRPQIENEQKQFLDRLLAEYKIETYVLWYYTPMALPFSRHLQPIATVFDCMDELSAFKNAPEALRERERELFQRADLIFTGGHSLYEVKRQQHPAVYVFPSTVESDHFRQAREQLPEPADQVQIAHPRLGFYGVLDERFDIALLQALADAEPDWQFVLIGPIVKIEESDLPRRENIHYLGPKSYQELPAYLAGWDAALLLFALNDATRFISPTKTLEYLAGGKPVVSTPIHDVISAYADSGLVHIAASPSAFVTAVKEALQEDRATRLAKVDDLLARTSWDITWSHMNRLIEDAVREHLAQRKNAPTLSQNEIQRSISSTDSSVVSTSKQ